MAKIEFSAKLWSAMEGKGWTFATLPKDASERLGARGRVPIEGTINGFRFRTSAFPDGKGGHTIQVNAQMREGARAEPGDAAVFVIQPATDEVKVALPADLKKALAASAKATSQWESITSKARAEWIAWVEGAKREETRTARVAKTVVRLAKGEKRV